jgi:hypothetical protein
MKFRAAGWQTAFALEAGTTCLDHGGFGVATREVLLVAFGRRFAPLSSRHVREAAYCRPQR